MPVIDTKDAVAPKEQSATVPQGAAGSALPAWRMSLKDAKRGATAAVVIFLTSLAVMAAGSRVLQSTLLPMGFVGLLTSFVIVMAAGARALVALGQMGIFRGPVGFKAPLAALGVGVMALLGMFFAFLGLFGLSRGRQLRRHGKVLLPPVGPGGAWARLPLEAEVPEALRAPLAARWRENGRTEHASVAAFARLTLDLMALGAPPDLIESANRDARDEIRHTELCFSLAKALDGGDGSPGAFPEAQDAPTLSRNRAVALAKLAVDSLVDGALNEGLSARLIGRLVGRCRVAGIRAMLRELAADEGRHCAHGWDVVEWCLKESGAPVANALRGAISMLPEEPATELPEEAQGGAWEAFGIHGLSLEREEYRFCRAALIQRVEAMIRASEFFERGREGFALPV
ncbi:MAG: ferritin-like domain-containing protein [Proteobacteria bacterium]|nr:ferritin-like domain-containing protein [Pseudomonadota bacterium]